MYGCIDVTGKEVIPVKYDGVHVYEKGARVELDGKFGLINAAGKEIVPIKYKSIEDRNELGEGLIKVELFDDFKGQINFSVLDKNGTEVIPGNKYSGIWKTDHPELFKVQLGTPKISPETNREVYPIGLFDVKLMEEIISCDFDNAWAFEYEYNGIKTKFLFARNYKSESMLFNEKGKLITQLYSGDTSFDFVNGMANVNHPKTGYGFIDMTGKEVISNLRRTYNFNSEGIALVANKDDKYIHINTKGEQLSPLFKDLGYFKEGVTYARRDGEEDNGKYGYIDKDYNEVLPFIYDDAWSFSEGLAGVKIDGKIGFIDESGEIAIKPRYDGIKGSFSNGVAKVLEGNSLFYIDEKGKKLNKVGYHQQTYDNYREMSVDHVQNKRGNLQTLINMKSENIVINVPNYESIEIIEGTSLACAKLDGKFCLFDYTNGIELTPLKYNSRISASGAKGLLRTRIENNGMYKYGYLNFNGKEVIPFEYDYYDLGDFSDGLALAKRDGKWGFFDSTGKEGIPFEYEDAYSFSEGLGWVKKDGKYVVIDTSGKVILS